MAKGVCIVAECERVSSKRGYCNTHYIRICRYGDPSFFKIERHGLKHSVEYRVWEGMRRRCHSPNSFKYYLYGGRGIKVCARWNRFSNFIADMGKRPSPDHSIDRIDNNGNYEPSNCRWATVREQANNRRDNRFITYSGKTRTLKQWSEDTGVEYKRLWARINVLGWSFERAIHE